MISCLITALVTSSRIVDIINNDPTSTWVAVDYPRHIITEAKMRAMCGLEAIERREMSWEAPANAPTSFDVRDRWPDATVPVRAQEKCGACWAFATTTAASIRFNIKGYKHGVLSPQDLISCDEYDNGCQGGSMLLPHAYMRLNGAATDACLPYVSGNGRVPLCPSKCDNGSAIVRHKFKEVARYTVDTVMDGLMNHGPMFFGFNIYEDFQHYRSGVYQHKTGKLRESHAVTLMGWGEENDVKYWLLQNSWGPDWGEGGFFKILRGTNECECEQSGFASGIVQ